MSDASDDDVDLLPDSDSDANSEKGGRREPPEGLFPGRKSSGAGLIAFPKAEARRNSAEGFKSDSGVRLGQEPAGSEEGGAASSSAGGGHLAPTDLKLTALIGSKRRSKLLGPVSSPGDVPTTPSGSASPAPEGLGSLDSLLGSRRHSSQAAAAAAENGHGTHHRPRRASKGNVQSFVPEEASVEELEDMITKLSSQVQKRREEMRQMRQEYQKEILHIREALKSEIPEVEGRLDVSGNVFSSSSLLYAKESFDHQMVYKEVEETVKKELAGYMDAQAARIKAMQGSLSEMYLRDGLMDKVLGKCLQKMKVKNVSDFFVKILGSRKALNNRTPTTPHQPAHTAPHRATPTTPHRATPTTPHHALRTILLHPPLRTVLHPPVRTILHPPLRAGLHPPLRTILHPSLRTILHAPLRFAWPGLVSV